MKSRQLVVFLIGVVLLTSVALAQEQPRLNPAGPSTLGLLEWHKSHYAKVEFPDKGQPLPAALESLFKQLLAFQTEQLKAWHMPPFADQPGEKTTWEASEERKAAFWEEIRKALPDRQLPGYSSEAWERFMAWDMPRLAAPYGLLAKPLYKLQGSFSPKRPYLTAFEAFVNFYPIEQVERETVTRWGQTVRRDICWIGEALWLEDEPEIKKAFVPSAGQVYFQTIFLFRPRMDRILWENLTEKERNNREAFLEKYREFRDRSYEQQLEQVLKATNPEKTALEIAYLKATVDFLTPPANFEEERARVLEHETRHLQDQADADYRERFMPLLTSLTIEHMRSDKGYDAHYELNGGLGELRYAPRKDESIRRFVILRRTPGQRQDYGHDTAGRTTNAMFVELFKKDPARYGLKFDSAIVLSAEGQFFLQFPDMANTMVERLAEDAMALHQSRYGEDLGEDFIKQQLMQSSQ